MRVIFVTVDLLKGREYLMPWRTILEVAKVMNSKGHQAIILNGCYDKSVAEDGEWQGVGILSVENAAEALIAKCRELKPDVMFIPFTFRSGWKASQWPSQVACRKVGYMTGGVYDLKSVRLLKSVAGWDLTKPYLLEALTPKSIFVNTMHKTGVDHIIGLTDATTSVLRRNGYLNVTTIYPGQDAFGQTVPDNSALEKFNLKGKKWLLFSGAPAPTRGADILLKAVDQAQDDSIRLVMLMRTDVGSEYESFNNIFNCMKHPERVQIIREKVTRGQLRAFFENAWYGLLPFVVIPSEVPLTYFELLSCGTPIITFKNGGTTEYLKDGLLIADKSVKGLTRALDIAWGDDALRNKLSENGKRIMAVHPAWEQVGLDWIKLLK